MFEVIMPKIGVLMETGQIEKWLKKEGDKVCLLYTSRCV